MTGRNYLIYDVFTDEALKGNQLAIVLDCDGLDTEAMQSIAREFNLSETVFVSKPGNPGHAAAIRIFTPSHEMPFAGHPTVGTAAALAESRGMDGTAILVLEEKIGPVRCAVSQQGRAPFAEFDMPRLSQELDWTANVEAIAAALGIDHHEIGFENHRIGLWSAGVPYVCIPVRDLGVAAKLRVDSAQWLALAPRLEGAIGDPYVYTRDTVNHDCDFHVRMFAPYSGIAEDPATGSAAAAFSGAILKYDQPVDGPAQLWLEQGIEMGRPSRIRLEIDVDGQQAKAARIGGHAVKVAEGKLFA